jgi:hypothetical protein
MRTLLVTALVGISALAASAEDVVLRPHYAPGDSYALSLTAHSNADLLWRGHEPSGFDENAVLRYSATVVVLETDASGLPTRERHQGAELTLVRNGESASPYLTGNFEVRRSAEGEPNVFIGGVRADRKVERLMTRVLAHQLEYSIGALVDPGRSVAVGESWPISEAQVRAYLKRQGVRYAELEEPASASLVRGSDGALAVRYRIPIASFKLRKLPANAHAARSQGNLEGEVVFGAQRRPVHHASTLMLEISGAVVKSGVSPSYPWAYRGTTSLEQRTRKVEPELASAY